MESQRKINEKSTEKLAESQQKVNGLFICKVPFQDLSTLQKKVYLCLARLSAHGTVLVHQTQWRQTYCVIRYGPYPSMGSLEVSEILRIHIYVNVGSITIMVFSIPNKFRFKLSRRYNYLLVSISASSLPVVNLWQSSAISTAMSDLMSDRFVFQRSHRKLYTLENINSIMR